MAELYYVDVTLRGGIRLAAESEEEVYQTIEDLESVQVIELLKQSGFVVLDNIEVGRL